MRWLLEHWRELARSILGSFGAIFLSLEAYEVLTDGNIQMSFLGFLAVGVLPGLGLFFLDGYRLSGFLRREVQVPNPSNDTKIIVKFGDLFAETGWKAIGVNDFFDNIVDEDLVSSRSLHGFVLNNYWTENRRDWEKQISSSLRRSTGQIECRSKGNRTRYPIGTTARACTSTQKFLFVALGRTDAQSNVTTANAEMLICAVRGMVSEARAACSMEPLVIPLMGSGMSRVGVKSSVLVDLIITAVLEESRHGRVTGKIVIVLPEDKSNEVNLKNHVRNWSDGK
ncbi:macro domain-containing protein [Roseobacter litoralis]|uniref:macro domain-containing protein n=1 Tax=Roseobacter litoralis TaxID=42443 RepID=UPI002492C53C|nr:macro domain-containing protein [Roseobacter litoralis]